MSPELEKRFLQVIVGIACLVPIYAGGMGVIFGPERFGSLAGAPVNLDSHFRYLSGILLAIGFAFSSCIVDIEDRGERFKVLAALVVTGGFARLISMMTTGMPSHGHVFGLSMELLVTPLLAVWQARIDRRFRAISGPRREAPHPLLGRKRH